jgi:hypothetical protein
MKITYIYPPLFKSFYPMSTRIMTENLLRNNHLEVHFSDIPVKAYSSHIHDALYENVLTKAESLFSPSVVSFLQQQYIMNNTFYVFMAHGYLDEYILQDFESKYVVITCINFCDLLIVRHLLENDKRVVLGGPLVNIGLSPKFIRDFLWKMGTDRSKLADNLIVVTGNIDLTTDFFEMIRNWQDASIVHNDFGTVYECQRDFLQDFYDGSSSIPVHFGFNNRCWYGKCKFCTYKKLPGMDLLSGMDDDRIIHYIHGIMDNFGATHLRFIDSYYHVNAPNVKRILEDIKTYDLTIYTGILLLKNREYIDFLNRYIDCLLIGLESTSDFSLNYINKGYTSRDIRAAVDNIIRYLDRRISLEISIILDLPAENEEDAKKNYRDVRDIKQKLTDAGFKVGVHLNILSVFPNMELLYLKDGRLSVSPDRTRIDLSTGKNYLVYLLRQAGMAKPPSLPMDSILLDHDDPENLYYGYISSDVPVMRYDSNDKILPSDLSLMEEDVVADLLIRTGRRSEKTREAEEPLD